MEILPDAGGFTAPAAGQTRHWIEHFRASTLSIGTYSLPVGGVDTQQPHTEDEVYVVLSGRARIVTTTAAAVVGPGTVIFVPAHEHHRFSDIEEDLAVLVIFAPPEYSQAA
jgi:mannose-6-phosphate isomerase-like protein (cupin superfamily)